MRINWSNPITRGLVYNQPLFEGSGNTAYELISNKTGSITNKLSNSWNKTNYIIPMMYFDGASASGQYVNTTMNQISKNLTTVSYSWFSIRLGNGGGNNGRVFCESDLSTAGHNLTDNATNWLFTSKTWSTTQGNWFWSLPANNVLNFYVLTYDSTSVANDPILYVNGIAQTQSATKTSPSGTQSFNDTNMIIGNLYQTGNIGTRTYNGYISDFCKWNRILTQKEVLQLYINPYQIYKFNSFPYSNALESVISNLQTLRRLMGMGR